MRLAAAPFVAYIQAVKPTDYGSELEFTFPKGEKRSLRGGGQQGLDAEQTRKLLQVLGVSGPEDARYKPILVIRDRKDRSYLGKAFILDESMRPNDTRITPEQRAYDITSELDLTNAPAVTID